MKKIACYLLVLFISFLLMAAIFCIASIPDVIFQEDSRALLFLLLEGLLLFVLPLQGIRIENHIVKRFSCSKIWYNVCYYGGMLLAILLLYATVRCIDVNALFPPTGDDLDWKCGIGFSLCFWILPVGMIWNVLIRIISFLSTLPA